MMTVTSKLSDASTLTRLMALEAVTVAAFSALHLSGALHLGSHSSPAYGAGTAEAVISLVLLVEALRLVRAGASGRYVALASAGFAVLAFLLGLSFTVRGGHAIDLIYHATMLPVLIATTLLLAGGVRGT